MDERNHEMSSKYRWIGKPFASLHPCELYDVLQLRTEVFVVEQQCIFQDMDGLDKHSFHLMAYHQDRLAAYTRLLPRGVAYPNHASIGRVVTAPFCRARGLGRLLMQKSIETIYSLWGIQTIQIGAQQYLQDFYLSLGFEVCGAAYFEDGIPHVPMLRPAIIEKRNGFD